MRTRACALESLCQYGQPRRLPTRTTCCRRPLRRWERFSPIQCLRGVHVDSIGHPWCSHQPSILLKPWTAQPWHPWSVATPRTCSKSVATTSPAVLSRTGTHQNSSAKPPSSPRHVWIYPRLAVATNGSRASVCTSSDGPCQPDAAISGYIRSEVVRAQLARLETRT